MSAYFEFNFEELDNNELRINGRYNRRYYRQLGESGTSMGGKKP